MRVLVTGGAGFLGSHLCDHFLSKGHEVIAMDNLLAGSSANIEHLAGHDRFLFIKHDVTNYILIEGHLPILSVLACCSRIKLAGEIECICGMPLCA
jgi:dTDP-glucose 4,6-dehydratase